jgi:hypothetical protein
MSYRLEPIIPPLVSNSHQRSMPARRTSVSSIPPSCQRVKEHFDAIVLCPRRTCSLIKGGGVDNPIPQVKIGLDFRTFEAELVRDV